MPASAACAKEVCLKQHCVYHKSHQALLAFVEVDSEHPVSYHFLSRDGFVTPANWKPDVLTLPSKFAAC